MEQQKPIRILQIDGGGLKGIIPAIICSEIEQRTGKPICEIFDMITGTSTGAVVGGALAAGIKASRVKEIYRTDVFNIFSKPRTKWLPWNWLRPKYGKNEFQKVLQKELGNISICDVKTKYMAATFNLCSQRTHFIKSWDEKDRKWSLADVISWSALSAVYYFGKINVPDYEWVHILPDGKEEKEIGAVFQDGGQGTNNSTLTFDLMECLAHDYRDVYILSIGTGDHDTRIKYKAASKTGLIGQIFNFFVQARNEAIPNQVMWARYVDNMRGDDFTVTRLNKSLKKSQDKMDLCKCFNLYEQIGYELASQVPFEELQSYKVMT